MKQAIIAIEDRRFYTNDGVDLRGIARALWPGRRSSRPVQGGSTITQQFVKNALAAQDNRTLFKKLREAALAYQLTRKWSKEQILAQLPEHDLLRQRRLRDRVGRADLLRRRTTRAATSAASTRCARAARSPAEAAMLAGIVASPERATTRSSTRGVAKRRRDLVLQRMLQQGYITPAAVRRRRAAQPMPDPRRRPAAARRTPSTRTSPRGSSSRSSTSSAAARGRAPAFEGGLTVKTTIDLELQQRRRRRDHQWLPDPAGPRAVAGGDRQHDRRGPRDGRRRRLRHQAVQPRHPGPAPARLGVQAVHPRRGAASRASPRTPSGPSHKLVINVPHSKEVFTVNNYEDAYSGITHARATRPTFSDNSVFAAGRHQGRHARRWRGSPSGWASARRSRTTRDDARRPQAGRHPARHGPRVRDVRQHGGSSTAR